MTAMTHEYDGGQCWCGPKCEPVSFEPVPSDLERTDDD